MKVLVRASAHAFALCKTSEKRKKSKLSALLPMSNSNHAYCMLWDYDKYVDQRNVTPWGTECFILSQFVLHSNWSQMNIGRFFMQRLQYFKPAEGRSWSFAYYSRTSGSRNYITQKNFPRLTKTDFPWNTQNTQCKSKLIKSKYCARNLKWKFCAVRGRRLQVDCCHTLNCTTQRMSKIKGAVMGFLRMKLSKRFRWGGESFFFFFFFW